MFANILAEECLQKYWQRNVCKYIGRGMIANILAEEGLQIYWQSNVCCKYIGRGMSAVVKLRAWVKCMREYWQNMCSTETAYCTL